MIEILSLLAFTLLIAAQVLAIIFCGRINAEQRHQHESETQSVRPARFWHRFVDL